MTNGEKLRQKSDEELLEFFFGDEAYLISMVIPHVEINGNMQITTNKTIRFIDWMKMEADE